MRDDEYEDRAKPITLRRQHRRAPGQRRSLSVAARVGIVAMWFLIVDVVAWYASRGALAQTAQGLALAAVALVVTWRVRRITRPTIA